MRKKESVEDDADIMHFFYKYNFFPWQTKFRSQLSGCSLQTVLIAEPLQFWEDLKAPSCVTRYVIISFILHS